MHLSASTKLEEDANFPQMFALPTLFNRAFDENGIGKVFQDSFDVGSEHHRGQAPVESARETERADSYFTNQYQFQSIVATAPTSFAFDQLRFPPSFNASATQPSLSTPQIRTRIPRPPNAFMLFRSDFLRRGVIPSHVERRQQNLSRIAGQCWNLLSPEEKGQWQEEAAKVLAEHQRRNPDYKFTPAPRGTRRPKGKGRRNSNPDVDYDEDRIRKIREEYTQLAGPSATPPRRRRPKTENRILVNTTKDEDITFRQTAPIPLSPSTSSSPSLSSESDSSLCLSSESPQSSFHQAASPRRPSTSLGFSTPLSPHDATLLLSSRSLTRPSSAAFSATDLCTPLRDLDITPTTATFGIASAPMKASPPILGPHSNPEIHFPEALRDPLPFSALNMPISDVGSASMPCSQATEGPRTNCAESFLSALYGDELFPLALPSLESKEFLPEEEVYSPYDIPVAFDCATLDLWNLNSPLLETSCIYNV